MTKQKTAVRQHIEHLSIMISEVKNRVGVSDEDKEGLLAGLEASKENAEHFLTIETRQIKQAYADGVCDGKIPNAKIKTQEKYFNEKFE